MRRIANALLASAALLLLAAPATATTVDLVDGNGSLDWDTSISSTSVNTAVLHPLFPANRHLREGWFLYLPTFGAFYEFTNFTKTSDGVSSDSFSSSVFIFGEEIILSLTYSVIATGPDGLPDLAWNGNLYRPTNPLSPFPTIDARLFNLYDYDVGENPTVDEALATFPGGNTVMELSGSGGVTGFRGVFGPVGYTTDTLGNVLNQIQVTHNLNNTAAAGQYDVVGAFQWNPTLCSAVGVAPGCNVAGSGSGGIGGFGGFGGFASVPEPAAGLLLATGLLALARRR